MNLQNARSYAAVSAEDSAAFELAMVVFDGLEFSPRQLRLPGSSADDGVTAATGKAEGHYTTR